MGRVYPRVGGGTQKQQCSPSYQWGLSPRGRGNLIWSNITCLTIRSIPAWAGEPIFYVKVNAAPSVYPRVGGGTALPHHQSSPTSGLSPRGRGNRKRVWCKPDPNGSIPAWAGEPASTMPSISASRVYPRVGGGTSPNRLDAAVFGGLSPRGRGNQVYGYDAPPRQRSIPRVGGGTRV